MEWAQQIIEQYGYWAVFIGTFAEGEAVFIAAAALAAAGLLEPWKVIVVAAIGAFIGHLFFFAIGRWRGMQIINSVEFLRTHHPKANRVLDHYAHWSVFIFQYLYGTRIVAAILFGCSSIGFWRFFLLQIVNCITWAIVIYTAGHFLGIAALQIIEHYGFIGLMVVVGIVAVVALLAWFGLHEYRLHHPQTEEEKDSATK
ncbi:MAG: VTT domain-containing protein [Mariprofundaceae bacterium]|nr:VTT domain-containing protein [Mariprofundaceae bacterium]